MLFSEKKFMKIKHRHIYKHTHTRSRGFKTQVSQLKNKTREFKLEKIVTEQYYCMYCD